VHHAVAPLTKFNINLLGQKALSDFFARILSRLTEDTLGSELLTLVHHHSLNVAEFACEIAGLAAITVLLNYATRWARGSLMAKLFITFESAAIIGLPAAIWIIDGANLHREIYDVLVSSWKTLLSPWAFIAA
jgi:hypothetical protein